MSLQEMNTSHHPATDIAQAGDERRDQERRDKPTLRFEFEGYAHRATDWSLDGFCVEWHKTGGLRVGDTFIIRGLAYGDLESAPVFLRAEVIHIGEGTLGAKFLDLNARGRRLFNDFMARWAIFELTADVA